MKTTAGESPTSDGPINSKTRAGSVFVKSISAITQGKFRPADKLL